MHARIRAEGTYRRKFVSANRYRCDANDNERASSGDENRVYGRVGEKYSSDVDTKPGAMTTPIDIKTIRAGIVKD